MLVQEPLRPRERVGGHAGGWRQIEGHVAHHAIFQIKSDCRGGGLFQLRHSKFLLLIRRTVVHGDRLDLGLALHHQARWHGASFAAGKLQAEIARPSRSEHDTGGCNRPGGPTNQQRRHVNAHRARCVRIAVFAIADGGQRLRGPGQRGFVPGRGWLQRLQLERRRAGGLAEGQFQCGGIDGMVGRQPLPQVEGKQSTLFIAAVTADLQSRCAAQRAASLCAVDRRIGGGGEDAAADKRLDRRRPYLDGADVTSGACRARQAMLVLAVGFQTTGVTAVNRRAACCGEMIPGVAVRLGLRQRLEHADRHW